MNFSEAVDITGTPQLELDFAGTPKAVDCVAATNTTWMGCYYEVVAGDVAAGGVAIAANKLTLNGGTITATGSTTITADLAHAAVAIGAGHTVDGIRPTLVTTGSEAPTTSTDGTQVILTFSEDISAVTLGSVSVIANSTSGYEQGATVSRSGRTVTLTLTPSLTIAAGWTVAVALSADAVEDAARNGNLALAATAVTNAIGTTTPTVAGVAFTSDPGADKTYAIGDSVEATVTFSFATNDAVDITGTPQLELDFAGAPKTADCLPDTGTSATTCIYTVVAGDSAPNGVVIAANTLTLNGGTITATSSTTTNADLAHAAVAIDAEHTVDGIRPTLVTTGSESPVTSTDGTQVILTFSEDISSVTLGNIDLEVNSTSGYEQGATVSRSGRTVTLTLTPSFTIAAGWTVIVALSADAVVDDARNGNLARGAGVFNAVGLPTPPGQPVAPSVSSVAGSTTSLLVTWTAPTNTGPAIDDYDLRYRQGTSGSWTTGPQNVSGTSATISGLTANTLYQVQVRATNSDGNSPWSPPGSEQTNGDGGGGGDGGGDGGGGDDGGGGGGTDPPLAVDDAAQTAEDTPVFIDVLGNDSDPDGDTLTVVAVSAPAHGTAVVADTGAVVYTPEPDFNGSDRFTYTVGDGSGLTAQAAVAVTVLPVNDPPQAVDDAAETAEDVPVTIAVRGNDRDGDGDALALVEASAPAHGVVA